MKQFIAIVLVLYSSHSFSCSLAPFTEKFAVNKNLQTIIPIAPSFEVTKLSRGVNATHSCSGLAFLRLKPKKLVKQEQGYTFEVIKGTLNIFDGKGPIKISEIHKKISEKYKTSNKNEFSFPFYENTNKPINITLEITAISKSGEKSKPQTLKIEHDGVKLLSSEDKSCQNKINFFSQQVNCT